MKIASIIISLTYYQLIFARTIEVTAPRISDTKDKSTALLEENGTNPTSIHSAIATLPGVHTDNNGFNTRNSSLFLRGNPSGHTQVLYDGIEINDPLGNQRYDFSFLTTTGINNIEVLHGPRNVTHGSNAIGGVIFISTMPKNRKPYSSANINFGSYEHMFTAISNYSKINSRWKNYLTGDYSSSKGYSAYTGGEPDGHKQYSFGNSSSGIIDSNTKLSITTKYINNETELDDFYSDDLNNKSFNKQLFAGANIEKFYSDGEIKNKLHLSYTSNKRKYIDEADNENDTEMMNSFNAQTFNGKFKNDIHFSNNFHLASGLGHKIEKGKSSDDRISNPQIYNEYIYLNADKKIHNTTLSAGIRGDYSSYSTQLRYPFQGELKQILFDNNLEITLRHATGFKPPSLLHLYSKYGNIELLRERSRSLSIDLKAKNGPQLSIYRTTTDNMIAFNWEKQKYYNLQKNRIHGIELSSTNELIKKTSTTFSYTRQWTKNLVTNKQLLYRPSNIIKARIQYKPIDKITLWSSITHYGSQSSYGSDELIKSYELIHTGIKYRSKMIEYFLTTFNFFNNQTELYQNQQVAGVSTLAGVKIVL